MDSPIANVQFGRSAPLARVYARAAFTVLVFLCSSINSAHAGAIYKTYDQNGNIIFTDQPVEGSESVNSEAEAKRNPGDPAAALPKFDSTGEPIDNTGPGSEGVLIAPIPKNPPKSDYQAPPEPTEFLPVTVVEILTPIHDTTLIDPVGKIWVEFQSFPTGMKKSGLTAELWMNDKLINSGKRTMLSLEPPERGTHVLRVKLVDDKGRLYLQTAPTHIHVKYRSNRR